MSETRAIRAGIGQQIKYWFFQAVAEGDHSPASKQAPVDGLPVMNYLRLL